MKARLSEHAAQYALSIPATTRGPRKGEVDGREYFLKTKEQFEQMIEDVELIEHACYVGTIMEPRRAMLWSSWKPERMSFWKLRSRVL
mgnify:CR=1 FL=1